MMTNFIWIMTDFALSESDRALEIDDSEKLERLANWCDMTPEEREDYKEEHHDEMKEKHNEMKEKHNEMKEKHNEMKEKHHEKMSELSPRLKEMIMDKRDISDERREEIKVKYAEKYGELSDEDKSELKEKFEKHMYSIRSDISDDRKLEIQERIAEMKAFKSELREKVADMTDEEKQQLGEEFIEKAKDMQLAWISPRTQITAGVDAADVECREGFILVMKVSNGVPMCLKADTALKMIDRGIAVPAN